VKNALDVVGEDSDRQSFGSGAESRSRAVHVVHLTAADNSAHGKIAAQNAKLEIHSLSSVKALVDAINQWRDADALALMSDERLLHRLCPQFTSKREK